MRVVVRNQLVELRVPFSTQRIPLEGDAFKPLDALLCHLRCGRVLLELLVLPSLGAYPSAKLRILGVSLRHFAASSMRVLVRNQLVEFRVPFSID